MEPVVRGEAAEMEETATITSPVAMEGLAAMVAQAAQMEGTLGMGVPVEMVETVG